MSQRSLPPWVVLHVPHDSIVIPSEVKSQFLLTDEELALEVGRMTDHFTHEIFAESFDHAVVVRSPISRLVVDVERFPDDADEPMAARGMGAVYTTTSHLTPLRRSLSAAEREVLMHTYYHPHHAALEAAVGMALDRYGRCLVIDCHSFPSIALPYEKADSLKERPDICIGTDEFHTKSELADAFMAAFSRAGFRVSLNDPFAGALVPASRYRGDERVSAVMVEVNRRLYLREVDATPSINFEDVARRVRQCCVEAIAFCD